jgi:glutamate/tyrosine decarboxylase-like PLP-dependent enzyme
MDLQRWLGQALTTHQEWAAGYGPYQQHPALDVDDEHFAAAFAEFTERLTDNYPFFHPRYAGQMLKPPHPAAVVGYLSAMLINPNNHALDGGPATAAMEREVVQQLAQMFGYPEHLGHLTTSGTIANLEALYVSRELHPGEGVAYSTEAHYTHGRMCGVLGIEGHPVPVDGLGRIDVSALDSLLAAGRVGTVVVTPGTTGLGAVEPVHEVLATARRHGVRVHVDAAYGGFFTLLAADSGQDAAPESLPAAPWHAIAECDSVVVDPHKHGLQPYGCGAVLFRDPAVGRFYLHDSPYTYFTSEELHLGEISLECSRPGAAAAAAWLTFRLLPPTRDGLGRVLAAGRRAALRWSELIEKSEVLRLYQEPQLDIVSFLPAVGTLRGVDAASARILQDGMADPQDPVFLSTLRVGADARVEELARQALGGGR